MSGAPAAKDIGETVVQIDLDLDFRMEGRKRAEKWDDDETANRSNGCVFKLAER